MMDNRVDVTMVADCNGGAGSAPLSARLLRVAQRAAGRCHIGQLVVWLPAALPDRPPVVWLPAALPDRPPSIPGGPLQASTPAPGCCATATGHPTSCAACGCGSCMTTETCTEATHGVQQAPCPPARPPARPPGRVTVALPSDLPPPPRAPPPTPSRHPSRLQARQCRCIRHVQGVSRSAVPLCPAAPAPAQLLPAPTQALPGGAALPGALPAAVLSLLPLPPQSLPP